MKLLPMPILDQLKIYPFVSGRTSYRTFEATVPSGDKRINLCNSALAYMIAFLKSLKLIIQHIIRSNFIVCP
jgi:hypothetical protein